MNITSRLTVASGGAVALASTSLFPVFDTSAWVPEVLGAVLTVVGVGLLARRLNVPGTLQPLLTLTGLILYLCQVFARSTLALGMLPVGRTGEALRLLVDQGRADLEQFGPPVPTHTGLVLLSTAGIGLVAVLVDLVAVVLDRAAVAGLPLLLLFAVPSAVLPGGMGWLPFGLGAAGWLGLLIVEGSERVERWGVPMRHTAPGARPGGDESSLGRVGRRIGACALGMAVLVPAVLPGLDHRLVGGTGGSGSGGGQGGTVRTTYDPIAQLQDELSLPQPRQLLVYTSTDPHPDYLRMTTLDNYTGAGWTYTRFEADINGARVQKGIPTSVGDTSDQRQKGTTRIGIDSLDVRWLPTPFGPTKVDVKGRWLWDANTQTIFSATRSTRDLPAYTVHFSRVLPDRNVLESASTGSVNPTVERRYGQPLEVSSYVSELADSVVKGQTSPYDRAVALQSFFRNPSTGFVYDLRASRPSPQVPDQLEAFLRGKHGFCEQYATAMAVMLRVVGVPSRLAVGFTPGTKVTGRNTYSVSTNDAHAWPEAWFAGTGWVRFEPTPAESRSTVPGYTLQAVPGGGSPTTATPGTATPLPSSTARPRGRNPEGLLRNSQGGGGSTGTTARGSSQLWPWAAVGGGLTLSILPFLLTRLRRRRRCSRPDALTAWQQLQDDAYDIGHRMHPAESPRAAASRLATERQLTGEPLAALRRIAAATERARYARPGSSGEPGVASDATLLRNTLREGVPRSTRWRAVILAPSTLRWASHLAGETVADVLDKVDEVFAVLGRQLRRI